MKSSYQQRKQQIQALEDKVMKLEFLCLQAIKNELNKSELFSKFLEIKGEPPFVLCKGEKVALDKP